MRAHVLITDKDTFPVVRDNGFWGVGTKNIPQNYDEVIQESLKYPNKKPYLRMIADILNTRVGDIAFLYERGVGFHGVYKVKSEPFFDTRTIGCVDGKWPLRIEIECLSYFPTPVPEDLLFSSKDYESKCWGWFYRKVQGPRGMNTVNPETAEVLVELLVELNGNAVDKPDTMKTYPVKKSERRKIELRLSKLSRNGRVVLEDVLRAWLVSHIDDKSCESVREVFGPAEDIEWFANNVPYYITRKHMDILVYHKNASYTGYPFRYKFTVMELKRGEATDKDVSQLINYSKWVAGRLAGGRIESVQPTLIAFDFRKSAKIKAANSDFSNRGVRLFAYKIAGDDIKFEEIKP